MSKLSKQSDCSF